MNVNLYLPDDLGARAKEAELPLSHLLQGAVVDELERRAMISNTLTEPQTFELQLEDEEGRSYTGRITGSLIATGRGDVELYLLDDERVIGYDPNRPEHWELGNQATIGPRTGDPRLPQRRQRLHRGDARARREAGRRPVARARRRGRAQGRAHGAPRALATGAR